MSINNVTLIGTLGRDPEVKYFESGTCVAQFSIALNNPPKDGQDQPPDWVEIKAWDKRAQVAADYLKKGHRVGIVGRLKQESWTERDSDQKRSKLTVVADRLELLTPRDQPATASAQAAAPAPAARPATTWGAPPVQSAAVQDDIPF